MGLTSPPEPPGAPHFPPDEIRSFRLPAKPSLASPFPASPHLAVLHFQSLLALEPPGSLSEQRQVVSGPVSGANGTYITPGGGDLRGDKDKYE